MIVEGYTAHLYCDRYYDGAEKRIGHPFGIRTNPWQVSGASKKEVHQIIKRHGWIVHKDGRVSCRKCLQEKRPFQDDVDV